MNELGKKGEQLAAKYYERLGFKIIAQNYILPYGKQSGELDLILSNTHQDEIVFVEVKTRRSKSFGEAEESIDRNKSQRLVRTAKMFLQLHKQYQDFDYRIDVALVDVDNLAQPVIIIPNAIEDVD